MSKTTGLDDLVLVTRCVLEETLLIDGDVQPEHLGRGEIDDEIELGWLLDRNFGVHAGGCRRAGAAHPSGAVRAS
jgi:hypothetical protein